MFAFLFAIKHSQRTIASGDISLSRDSTILYLQNSPSSISHDEHKRHGSEQFREEERKRRLLLASSTFVLSEAFFRDACTVMPYPETEHALAKLSVPLMRHLHPTFPCITVLLHSPLHRRLVFRVLSTVSLVQARSDVHSREKSAGTALSHVIPVPFPPLRTYATISYFLVIKDHDTACIFMPAMSRR